MDACRFHDDIGGHIDACMTIDLIMTSNLFSNRIIDIFDSNTRNLIQQDNFTGINVTTQDVALIGEIVSPYS